MCVCEQAGDHVAIAGVLSFFDGYGITAPQLRRGIFESADITCAAVLQIMGAVQPEGHDIIVGYGDGSLQLFSMFDWKFLYRIPPSRVPWGRGRPSAVRSIIQLTELAARIIVGYHDGCFSVWRRHGFGSFKCEHVVIAHSDAVSALAQVRVLSCGLHFRMDLWVFEYCRGSSCVLYAAAAAVTIRWKCVCVVLRDLIDGLILCVFVCVCVLPV